MLLENQLYLLDGLVVVGRNLHSRPVDQLNLPPAADLGQSRLLKRLEDEVLVGGDLADSAFLDDGVEGEHEVAFEELEEVGVGDEVGSAEEGPELPGGRDTCSTRERRVPVTLLFCYISTV